MALGQESPSDDHVQRALDSLKRRPLLKTPEDELPTPAEARDDRWTKLAVENAGRHLYID